MGLIAIDKQNRKILGYLCKNNQTIAYCCGDCDVEFPTVCALEEHMVMHDEEPAKLEENPHTNRFPNDQFCNTNPISVEMEQKSCENTEPIPQVDSDDKPDRILDEVEVPSKELSSVERENLLKIKYQVTPCSVKLDRDEMHSIRHLTGTQDITTDDNDDDTDEESTSSEPLSKCISKTTVNKSLETFSSMACALESKKSPTSMDEKRLKRKRQAKKSADLQYSDEVISSKRRKTPTKTAQKNISPNKKPPKTKPHPQFSMCFLCGARFTSSIQLTQHQKTHFASTSSHSPVFPCKVCGRQVKNLKNHLRQHKNEIKNQQPSTDAKPLKYGKQLKSNESQKSNGSFKSAGLKLITKGPRTIRLTTELPAAIKKVATVTSDTLVKRAEASSSTDAVFSKAPCDNNPKETELISSNEVLTNSNDSNASSYNLIGECLLDTNALLIASDQMSQLPPSSTIMASSTFSPSSSLTYTPLIDRLSLIYEDPLQIGSMDILEPMISGFSADEPPSQSTLGMASNELNQFDTIDENALLTYDVNIEEAESENQTPNDELQPAANNQWHKCPKCPRLFDSLARVQKHCIKHQQKVNCSFCGKLLAESYIKVHISKYHESATRNDVVDSIPLNIVGVGGYGEGEQAQQEEQEEEGEEKEEAAT